ncbi:hypothetical protein EVG20_g11315, partial [Dentipellis fragilis]
PALAITVTIAVTRTAAGPELPPRPHVVPERDNVSTRAVHGGSTPGTDLDTRGSAAGAGSDSSTAGESAGSAYPPQRHAGKVGYGPHYGDSGAGIGDEITGLKEEVLGKRREKADQDAANNPFAESGEKQDQGQDQHRSRGQDSDYERATVTAPAGTEKAGRQVGEEHLSETSNLRTYVLLVSVPPSRRLYLANQMAITPTFFSEAIPANLPSHEQIVALCKEAGDDGRGIVLTDPSSESESGAILAQWCKYGPTVSMDEAATQAWVAEHLAAQPDSEPGSDSEAACQYYTADRGHYLTAE